MSRWGSFLFCGSFQPFPVKDSLFCSPSLESQEASRTGAAIGAGPGPSEPGSGVRVTRGVVGTLSSDLRVLRRGPLSARRAKRLPTRMPRPEGSFLPFPAAKSLRFIQLKFCRTKRGRSSAFSPIMGPTPSAPVSRREVEVRGSLFRSNGKTV